MNDEHLDGGTPLADSVMKVQVGGDVTAKELSLDNSVRVHFEYNERGATRPFAIKSDGFEVGSEQQKALRELFVGDSAGLERLVEQVERCRILLLTGEAGIGKAMTALYIADRLSKKLSLKNTMRLIEPLDPTVRIELRSAAQEDGFRSRATLFVDAFEQKNGSLITFFSRTERIGWEQLSDLLRHNEACLLFTSANVDVAPFRQRIGGHVVHHQLAPLAPKLLEQGLDRKIELLRVSRPDRAERCNELTQHRTRVVSTLQTMSRVTRFVDEFVDGDEDLLAWLRKFTNPEEWFIGLNDRDFETWCAVLTLTLAQPVPDATSIPWLDFERLRRAISQRISSDPELFPSRDDDGKAAPYRSLSDKQLLQGSRAMIAKDAERLSDVIRFADPTQAAELWKTLLTHYRRLLAHIAPTLRNLAEQERGTGRLSLRVLATQILGRIGEIDPPRLSLPLMRIWASSTDLNQRPLVGRLAHGVLASGNTIYRQAALREIAMLADSDLALDEEAAQDRLVTAIAAYAQIGPQVPDVTMEALGRIAMERLAPAVAEIHKVWRSAEGAAIGLNGARHHKVAISFQRRFARLTRIANELDEQQAAALLALRIAIVQLCLATDPISTLAATRRWGGAETGVLLSVLFLHGIAGELHTGSELVAETNTRIVVSPLLISLGSRSEAVEQFAEFLADLRASLAEATFRLPAELQRDLEEKYSSLLTAWARDAVETPYRQAVLDLFATLAQARNRMLRAELYNLVGTPAFAESDALRVFANDVRKRLSN